MYDPRTGKMRKTKVDVKLFNLDVIISVGYRVNSIMGVTFRKWANEVLNNIASIIIILAFLFLYNFIVVLMEK